MIKRNQRASDAAVAINFNFNEAQYKHPNSIPFKTRNIEKNYLNEYLTTKNNLKI
jgi:hypothetical protein